MMMKNKNSKIFIGIVGGHTEIGKEIICPKIKMTEKWIVEHSSCAETFDWQTI